MHDYNDETCITILRHLRNAASPSTYLIIGESVASSACSNGHTIGTGMSGESQPSPLLQNHGDVGNYTHMVDILVCSFIPWWP